MVAQETEIQAFDVECEMRRIYVQADVSAAMSGMIALHTLEVSELGGLRYAGIF